MVTKDAAGMSAGLLRYGPMSAPVNAASVASPLHPPIAAAFSDGWRTTQGGKPTTANYITFHPLHLDLGLSSRGQGGQRGAAAPTHRHRRALAQAFMVRFSGLRLGKVLRQDTSLLFRIFHETKVKLVLQTLCSASSPTSKAIFVSFYLKLPN